MIHNKYTFFVKKSTLLALLGAAVMTAAACQPVNPAGAVPTTAPAATAEVTSDAIEEATAEATAEATSEATPEATAAAPEEATAEATAAAAADAAAAGGTVQVNVGAGGIDMPPEIPSGIVTFTYQMADDAPGMRASMTWGPAATMRGPRNGDVPTSVPSM